MPTCRENRRNRLRRRRRAEHRAERREREYESNAWLCACGHWEESGYHCSNCLAEPPWGCPCDEHGEEEFDEIEHMMMLEEIGVLEEDTLD